MAKKPKTQQDSYKITWNLPDFVAESWTYFESQELKEALRKRGKIFNTRKKFQNLLEAGELSEAPEVPEAEYVLESDITLSLPIVLQFANSEYLFLTKDHEARVSLAKAVGAECKVWRVKV